MLAIGSSTPIVPDLTAQTLHQQAGFATTLLRLMPMDKENGGIDQRFSRAGG